MLPIKQNKYICSIIKIYLPDLMTTELIITSQIDYNLLMNITLQTKKRTKKNKNNIYKCLNYFMHNKCL